MTDKETLDRKTTPPGWCKDAVLDFGGWKDPNTGEVLVARRTTQEEIEHFNNRNKTKKKKQKHEPSVIEAPDESQPTTTETLTPDERDSRTLLEETDYDEPSQ